MHGLVAVGCRRRAVFSIAEEMVLICSVWPATSLPRSMKISLTSLTVVCPGARGLHAVGRSRWWWRWCGHQRTSICLIARSRSTTFSCVARAICESGGGERTLREAESLCDLNPCRQMDEAWRARQIMARLDLLLPLPPYLLLLLLLRGQEPTSLRGYRGVVVGARRQRVLRACRWSGSPVVRWPALTAGAALRKLLEAAEHKLEVLVELVEHGSLPCRHSARVLAALQRHELLTRLAGESTGVLQQRAKLPRIVARGLHPRKDAIVPADDPDVLDHLV